MESKVLSVTRWPEHTDLQQPTPELRLLGEFKLVLNREETTLPGGVQKLLALLALLYRPVLRTYAASQLWSNAEPARVGASLRSTLWRLSKLSPELLVITDEQIGLAEHVWLDVRAAESLTHRVINAKGEWTPDPSDIDLLSADLLPGWYDEWVIVERERFRQLRLHALEALCTRLTEMGEFGRAAQAGLAAVVGEPLRESANRILIQTYLAEGNPSEAIRQFESYRHLLASELGREPSEALHKLVHGA
ncbi:MAG: hypothetical protein NVSMB57_09400 [Actinomycetota bacterium]